MQSTGQVNSVQIHSSKTDFCGVDIVADPYQQSVEDMKGIRFLKFQGSWMRCVNSTSGGRNKCGTIMKPAITKDMMYEFLYATRTVSVEHGQTQKYEKKMAEIKQNILGCMPATLYRHGKPIEGDSRGSASMFPIKAVNIIKRLMLSRRPKRTKAPIYGVEGRYREFVST